MQLRSPPPYQNFFSLNEIKILGDNKGAIDYLWHRDEKNDKPSVSISLAVQSTVRMVEKMPTAPAKPGERIWIRDEVANSAARGLDPLPPIADNSST